jgi:glycerol-3-phosphate acyltransferase PlsY
MSSIILMGIVFTGSYGLASIPFGLIITRMMGHGDLRRVGSGNIGATNVLRTGSKFAAALTLIFDIGKGGLAVVITAQLVGTPLLIAIAAVAGVIGHCYPVWLKFRGGKGVATGIGVVLALNPLAGLGMGFTWLLTAGLFRMSSLASLTAYISTPVWIYVMTEAPSQGAFVIATVIIAALSFWRHRDNINRIIAGKEPRIGK